MASDFIGYTVLVTLKSPPNSRVQGVVADVVGPRLTLQDGMCLDVLVSMRKDTAILTELSDLAMEWPTTTYLPYRCTRHC